MEGSSVYAAADLGGLRLLGPAGLPTPEDFELVQAPGLAPGPGQFLIRNVWLSIDLRCPAGSASRAFVDPPVAHGASRRHARPGMRSGVQGDPHQVLQVLQRPDERQARSRNASRKEPS